MAIYDRISLGTPSEDRISANLWGASWILVQDGQFTVTQMKNKFDNRLNTPLTVAEKADIDAIEVVRAGLSTQEDQLQYLMVLRAAAIAVEEAEVGETAFNVMVGL